VRSREEISKDGLRPEFLILETLLDIRDLLKKKPAKYTRRKRRKKESV